VLCAFDGSQGVFWVLRQTHHKRYISSKRVRVCVLGLGKRGLAFQFCFVDNLDHRSCRLLLSSRHRGRRLALRILAWAAGAPLRIYCSILWQTATKEIRRQQWHVVHKQSLQ